MQARRVELTVLSVQRKKNPTNLEFCIQRKLSFKSEGEIMTSSDKQKLRELISSRPALQEMLKDSLQAEGR